MVPLHSVFFFMFFYSWPLTNSSTARISANLEKLEEEAMILRKAAKAGFTFLEALLKGGKTNTIFFISEKIRMWVVIGHTIFFTSEKNCRPIRLFLACDGTFLFDKFV